MEFAYGYYRSNAESKRENLHPSGYRSRGIDYHYWREQSDGGCIGGFSAVILY